MADTDQTRRRTAIGVAVITLLGLLIGLGSYVAISQALTLGRVRIEMARQDAVLLRTKAMARIESAAAAALARVPADVRGGAGADRPVGTDGPRWLGDRYLWDGTSLTTLRRANRSAAESCPAGTLDRLIAGWLENESGRLARAGSASVSFISSRSAGGPIVLACLVVDAASSPPVVAAAAVDTARLKADLLDPLFAASETVRVVASPSDSPGLWHESLAAAFDPLCVEPAGAFVAEQRRRVMLRVGLYAAVTAAFVVALALTVRRFLAIVRREVALSQLKSSFAADVSHELKTPLALIRMFSEMLSEQRVATEEKKQEYYAIITRESTRLTHLIDNILDFSRIEAGKKAYEFKPVDMADVVRATYETYRFDLDHRGFEHTLSIEANLPEVDADADAIGQVLLNLMSNAVKYSRDEKRIDIEVSRETRRGKHGVLICVKDSGIGIKPEDRAHLFDGFFRAGDDRVRRVRGAGLGLSVVKHIVEAHGGIVDAESRLVKGTAFRIFLPQSARNAGGQVEDRPAPHGPSKGP